MGAPVLHIDVNGLCASKYVPEVGNSAKRGGGEALAPRPHRSTASRLFEKLLLSFVCTPVLAEQLVGDLQPESISPKSYQVIACQAPLVRSHISMVFHSAVGAVCPC